MNKVLKIKGLDCPNCAKALEGQIKKIDGIENVELNFLKGTITFNSALPNCIEKIKAVVKQVEPQAEIEEPTAIKKANKTFFLDLSILLIGIIVAVVVIFGNLQTWLFWPLFIISAFAIGYKTYIKAIKLLIKGVVNENLLVTLSIIGATAVGEYMEGLMVIALYTIGKLLEGFAVNKSRSSIKELTNLKPDYANVLRNGKEQKVAPEDVKIGEIVLVKAGERVAIDGIVVEGTCNIDTQSLTGESLPSLVKENSAILSGSIVVDGVLKIKTTSIYAKSTINKILLLIEKAQEKKSKTETVISKIARWYTFAVMGLSILVFALVWLVLKDVNVAIYRALIFLLISCPCAFAISVPLSYFSGIGLASKNGILIKGTNYLDLLAKLDLVAFDKTGTLTTGKFVIDKIEIKDKTKSEEEILFLASLGEQYSLHPLAKSIVKANTKPLTEVKNVKEIAGKGVSFCYKNKNYFVGRREGEKKQTTVDVVENDLLIGKIFLFDSIKPTSTFTCKQLKSMGIKTVLISGDNKEIVNSVAKEVGVDENYAQLLPQQKYELIEIFKKKSKFLGYVGDGINDAPSLMRADIGISMGINGSSSSIEASNVVLVDDNPQKVVSAIKISKFARKIVWQNIFLSAGVKVLFLSLGAFGITGMLSAVIADVGVTLMAILNSLRVLGHKVSK